MKQRMKNKSKKINKNEIISYKRTKKIQQGRLNNYITHYNLFGGGYKWEKFKQTLIFNTRFNKITYMSTRLINQKNLVERSITELLNHIVILNNFITRKIIKRIIRLFEYIKISSYDNRRSRRRKIDKNRKKIKEKIFGYNYSTFGRGRNVLKMRCKRNIYTRVECLIKTFRQLEVKYNSYYLRYKNLLENFNAEYSIKYRKFLKVLSNYDKYKDKLSPKSKQIIARAKKESDNINELDEKIKKIHSECNDYNNKVTDMFNKNYPHYGFERYEEFLGLHLYKKYFFNSFRKEYFKVYSIKNKQTKDDFTNNFKIDQINTFSNLLLKLNELIKNYDNDIKNIGNNTNKTDKQKN